MDAPKTPLFFSVDGVPYRAWSEPDLGWLSGYGRVVRVMDRQSPDHLLFFVEGRYGRLLIKYAGARTVNGRADPADAVLALRDAMRLYAFDHPALLRPVAHGPAGGGYAAVFPWRGDGFLRSSPPDPSVLRRVRHLALGRSLKMLDGVFDLHVLLAAEGVIASDFHDGHVLVDFARDEAVMWDIDRYLTKPAVNRKGRMPGYFRFMAPEEYALDAPLDERTTVYNLGALAFAFFSDGEERSRRAWAGPDKLWDVARQATQEKSERRYPSLKAFQAAWRQAVGESRLY